MKSRLENDVRIIDIADKGRGVGKVENKTVFVEGAVPGDVADVEIFKRSKSFDEGKLLNLKEPSPWRTTPDCSHFGICGGCRWQHLEYGAQLRFKEKMVIDAMQRIAHISDPPISPIAGSEAIFHYRNKLEFTFTDRRYLLHEEMDQQEDKELNGLGFHIPGKFNKVLDIHRCHLQDHRSDAIRNFVRDFALSHHYTFFNLKTQVGLLRNLIIRNTTTDEWMVVVVFKEDEKEMREALLDAIRVQFPFINSLHYIINAKRNDSIHDQTPVLYYGAPVIIEEMGELKFRIGPKSFFQTNPAQAFRLYNMVKEYASLAGDEVVYDLYTGTGSIASFVSSKAKRVIGVEYVQEAIDDAFENAKLNSITNMDFIAGDMKDVLTADFFKIQGKPDVIITDPPRAGMHEAVVKRILESGAKRLVYVSCNPATQARDLLLLSEKYRFTRMQPVDMFPHTHHVENVVLCETL